MIYEIILDYLSGNPPHPELSEHPFLNNKPFFASQLHEGKHKFIIKQKRAAPNLANLGISSHKQAESFAKRQKKKRQKN